MPYVKRLFPILLCCLAILAACETKPDPTLLNAHIAATEKANPDGTGNPSPVVVRYYELKELKTFAAADFFDIYEQADTVLASDLLNWGQIELQPGEAKDLALTLKDDTRYVGFIAAFQSIDQAQWRGSIPIAPTKVNTATVSVDALNLSVQ